MELLKNLTEHELSKLRAEFSATEANALSPDEFEDVIVAACKRKGIEWQNLKLQELFNDIDVNGDGTVSWDEFTDFAIKGASNAAPSGEGAMDAAIRCYRPLASHSAEVPGSVFAVKYIERENLIMKFLRTGRFSKIKLCCNTPRMQLYRETPKPPLENMSVAAACVIPTTKEVICSGVLAAAYTNSVVRFYDIHRVNHLDPNVMVLRKELAMPEGQTALAWCAHYRRLVAGSRSGVVSVLDVDQGVTVGKERVHAMLVSDMIVRGANLYTASIDASGAVKGIDMEHSVVRFALNGHEQGACRIAVNCEMQQLYSVGFELEPLVYSLTTPRMAPYKLVDSNRPHHKRIVGLEAVEGTPQVITADVTGIVKVWDVRMYACVQTIAAAKDGIREAAMLSCIGFVGPRKHLIMCGRDTKVFEYDTTSKPQQADDAPCNHALFNPMSRSFLTVHQRAVKLWDSECGALRTHREEIRNPDENVPAFAGEIVALCLALPLGRKFFVGTSAGELFSVSYAVCEVMRPFPRDEWCPPHVPAAECSIVQLEYVDGFKDNDFPYVMVVLTRAIVLVPDAEEHVQRSALPIHCLGDVVGGGTGATTLRCATVASTSRLIVGTVNGSVHVVDLTTFLRVASFNSAFTGEIVALTPMAVPLDPGGPRLPASLCFFADSLSPAVIFADSAVRDATLMCRFGSGANDADGAPPPARATTVAVTASGAQLPQLLGGPRPNSAVAACFMQRRDVVFRTCVTVLAALPAQAMLAAGDEKGLVTLFDIAPLLQRAKALTSTQGQCAGGEGGAAADAAATPPLVPSVHSWSAHDGDIVAMCAIDVDGDAPSLMTCAGFNVHLWSLDGQLLGSLCQGRPFGPPPCAAAAATTTVDAPAYPRNQPDTSGGSACASLPGFFFDTPPTNAWDVVRKYMEDRNAATASSPLDADELSLCALGSPQIQNPGSNSRSSDGTTAGSPPAVGAPEASDASATFLTAVLTPLAPHPGVSASRSVASCAQERACPPRFRGLVNPAKVDFSSIKLGALKSVLPPQLPKCGVAVQAAHHSLPEEAQPPPFLNTLAGGNGHAELRATARCCVPALPPLAASGAPRPHLKHAHTARQPLPPHRRHNFVKFDRATTRYLRSVGMVENPLESTEQRQLRRRGHVVLRRSSAGDGVAAGVKEPSVRVL